MEWRYTLGPADRLAHYRFQLPPNAWRILQNMLPGLLCEWAVLVLAFVQSVHARTDGFTLVFGIALTYQMQRSLRYPWQAKRVTEDFFRSGPEHAVVLTAGEDGLVEETCGIKSHAPWSSVKYFGERDGRIFVSLASEMWAIVTGNALESGSATLQDLRSLLEQHHIPEKGKTGGWKE